MKLVNGAIELEQVDRPGSLGDSCAETARYAHLRMLLGNYEQDYNLHQFVTPFGYIRHPLVPEDWRESDFSSDQALPLYLAFRRSADAARLNEMEHRLRSLGYRTGNGDLISPGLFAEAFANWLRTPLLLLQLALFKLPYRWNDEKRAFEATTGSSADYINFVHVAVYAPAWLRKRLNSKLIFEKVCHYYAPEPHSANIKNLYFNVISEYFSPVLP